MVSPDSRIIIVGGGVFGLSTALHLARGGYKDITIFDRCAFDKNHYNPMDGCDGASADINKIFRASYADKEHYQGLAIEARDEWLAWNEAIRESSESDLPAPLTPTDKLLDVCGVYYLGEGPVLRDHYVQSLQTMEKLPQFRSQQFLKNSTEDEERLRKLGGKWIKKYHAIDDVNGGDTSGFLDTSGGIMIADKACTYALFLCKQLGVKFVLGDPQGKLESLISERKGLEKKVTGIKTCDGQIYHADLVVVACGAWTATVLPETSRAVEATSGGTLFIDVPEERQDLWEKFRSDNYPVWHFRKGKGDTYYEGGSFPISNGGRLKFGFRGKKFTNFQNHPTQSNLRISTPRTKYTKDTINTVPLHGLELVKGVIGQAFPELMEFGFTDSRLCWYTDSIDNEFFIDYVPGYSDSLFVCTGGSGHGFKFLPVLGKYAKHQLARVPDQFTQRWQWRTLREGKLSNGLEEGENGPRDIKKQNLAAPSDFKFVMETTSKL